MTEWQFDLYQKILGRTEFAEIKINGIALNVRSQRAEIAASPNRQLRKEGFRKLYEGFESGRDLYAFALIKLVEARNRIAKLRHFQDEPEQIYFNSYWKKDEVHNLIERIEARSDIYKRYQRMRAEDVQKRMGYSEVYLWDLSGSLTGDSVPRFTIQKASEVIRKALSPLGPDYGRELALLLDPANGRMDIVPGKNRKSGGFSKGFPGVPTVFFASGFHGYYNDVRILTHESTHAIHRQLMNNGDALPLYAEGPHYLFESFAIFNELLLPDYLYNVESDPKRRRYFLEQFFDGKGMALFYVAQDAKIEQAIYEEAEKGNIRTADDLDGLTERVSKRYSIWPEKHKEMRMRWITNALFYEDPLYNINYVYGSLLALKYYSMFKGNPEDFVPRYIALLKNGFNAEPAILLKKFLDINLTDRNLLTDAIDMLSEKMNDLNREYSETK
jgi:oligoendopeptidase F